MYCTKTPHEKISKLQKADYSSAAKLCILLLRSLYQEERAVFIPTYTLKVVSA
jgi:hypothetical protein